MFIILSVIVFVISLAIFLAFYLVTEGETQRNISAAKNELASARAQFMRRLKRESSNTAPTSRPALDKTDKVRSKSTIS